MVIESTPVIVNYAWAILLATVRSRSSLSLFAWKAASLQACMPVLSEVSATSSRVGISISDLGDRSA
jgi:hypothetical protein